MGSSIFANISAVIATFVFWTVSYINDESHNYTDYKTANITVVGKWQDYYSNKEYLICSNGDTYVSLYSLEPGNYTVWYEEKETYNLIRAYRVLP